MNNFCNSRLSKLIVTPRSLVFFALFFFVGIGQLSAQEIQKDFVMPQMNACGAAEEVTVAVKAGTAALNGSFSFTIPAGFELVGPVRKTGDLGFDGTTTSVTVDGNTKYTLASQTIVANGTNEYKFDVRATCAAIIEDNDTEEAVVINYEFVSGGDSLVAESEALNVNYAVFHIATTTTSTNGEVGVAGDPIARTITITNNGNGSISGFVLQRTFTGLVDETFASVTLPSTTPDGTWDWETVPGGNLVYTASSPITNGQSVTFLEDLRIDGSNCDNLKTEYVAYYGCDLLNPVCRPGADTLEVQTAFDRSKYPVLEVEAHEVNMVTNTHVECLTGSNDVLVWKVTNTGSGIANNINLNLTTGGITTVAGSMEWTADIASPSWSTGPIPDLVPGESFFMRATQQHQYTAGATCGDNPESVSFGLATVTGTYGHANGCTGDVPIAISHTLRNSINYSFDVLNIGALEVQAGESYLADFVASDFTVDPQGLGTNAKASIVLTLNNLTANGPVRVFDYEGTELVDLTWTESAPGSGVYTLEIPYGVAPRWATGTTLNLAGLRILFDATVGDCTAGDPSYSLSTSLYRGDECGSEIALQCLPTEIEMVDCPLPGCTDGLNNGLTVLRRVNIGPDQVPANSIPAGTSASTNPLIRTTAFTTNDILEISRAATVNLSVGSPEWTNGAMKVILPTNLVTAANWSIVGGSLEITRGGDVHTVSITPTKVGNEVTLSLDITAFGSTNAWPGSLADFSGFLEGDALLMSVRVRPTAPYGTAVGGEQVFGVTAELTDNGGVGHICAGGTDAYGYFAADRVTLSDGSGNITDCDGNASASVTFDYSLINNQRNGLFPLEYRGLIRPTQATFTQGSGAAIQITNVKVELLGQGFSGSTDVVPDGSGMIDLSAALQTIQGNPTGGPYLDEGFRVRLTTTAVSTCPTAATGTVNVNIAYQRPNTSGAWVNAGNVTSILTYNTGYEALAAAAAATNSYVSDATGPKWVIRIDNRSAFRNLESVWLKRTGGVVITSMTEVTSYTNMATPVGSTLTTVDADNYTLGTIAPGGAKYYLIESNDLASFCDETGLNLEYGYTCGGAACGEVGMLDLEFTMGQPRVQARVIYETKPTNRPMLCADLPYAFEINNAGSAVSKGLEVTIPIVSMAHLTYVPGSLRLTGVYTGATSVANPGGEPDILADFDDTDNWAWGSSTGYTPVNDADVSIVVSPSWIRITIPAGIIPDLPAGQKINVGFKLAVNGCDFRSGQRIRFQVGSENICGKKVPAAAATSARVTVMGADDGASPEVAKSVGTAVAVATLNPPGPLYAAYNVTFQNTTSNTYPLRGAVDPILDPLDTNKPDQRHRISIKLPADWVFDDEPENLFAPEEAQFVELDPVIGYIFVLKRDVPSGQSIGLVDKQIRYAGTEPEALACGDWTIEETIFRLFSPDQTGCPPGFGSCLSSEHVIYEGTTPLVLAIDPPIVSPDRQVFCASENPRVSDLLATGPNLRFYRNATGGLPLDPTTLLNATNNSTYYVTSSLVPNGECQSERVAIPIHIPIAAITSGALQSDINVTSFTVTATAPAATRVTGRWTIESVTGADLAQVGFGTAGIHTVTTPTATVRLPIGAQVIARWTLIYNTCQSSYAETTLRSLINTIEAVDNYYATINSKTGTFTGAGDTNVPLTTVLNNTGTPSAGRDLLAGAQATTGNVKITPSTPNHPNLSMNSSTGVITVVPNTPAGTYQYPYTICEVANPTNCDNAVAYITVVAPDITANDNNFTSSPISGNGGNTPSVLPDDQLNNTDINPADVTISVKENPSNSTHLTLNVDGTITVAPGTPSGDYTLNYRICEILNPTNCDDAVATVRVRTPIDAVNDGTYQVRASTTADQPVGNALDNDTLNGLPATQGSSATSNTVTVSTITPATPIGANPNVPVLDPNGDISVPMGTPAGDYVIEYRICENNLTGPPTNCDQAMITIKVTDRPIVATPNTYGPVKGNVGEDDLGNVLSDDLLDGSTATVTDVTLAVGTATWDGGSTLPTNYPRINTTAPSAPGDPAIGAVIVPQGTPDGVYTIPYTICEAANTDNCATSYARVTVGDATIDAKDNHFTTPISGSAGGTTTSVIVDDRLNGDLLVIGDIGLATDPTKKVTLTPGTAPSPTTGSISMNPDGTIEVGAGTTAGVYTYPYTICEILNPDNCDNAVAVITVSAGPILADNDIFGPINGATGESNIDNVFTNDSFDGSTTGIAALVTDGTLTVSIVHDAVPVRTEIPGLPVPTLSTSTGQITVPPGTPAGTYNITYRICEALNPTNCDDAIVTINVEAPAIVADADTYTFNGQTGAETTATVGVSVLGNDELNGTTATAGTVTLTPGTSPHPGITMDANGIISVDPGTPAATYTYPYTICEVLNPTNCTTGIATITVTAPTITAVADPSLNIPNGANGGTTTSVLDNDVLGNENPLDPSDVRVIPGTVAGGPSTVTDPSQYLVMNPDGTITVRPGTPAGDYTYTYTICEILNPTNCSTVATATIEVGEADIDAVDNDYDEINGATGHPNVGNILGNDLLNNVQATLDKVEISIVTPANSLHPDGLVPVLDPNTGIVSVPAGTPVSPDGVYTIEYRICEILNPTNCDNATITIDVVAAPLEANADTYGPVKGNVGDDNLGNVLINDIYNGRVPTLADVTVTSAPFDPLIPVPYIDNTGQVVVASGTPDGIYTITYSICDKLNAHLPDVDRCKAATVTVTVGSSTIDAVDNLYPAISSIGGGSTTSVLSNDLLNGTLLDPAKVTLKRTGTDQTGADLGLVTGPIQGSITMNTDGTITVAPNTTAGTYQYRYEICELLNPSNCDQALATIVVTADPIVADNDSFGPFNGADGGASASVLDNDKLNSDLLNGVAADPALVEITEVHAATPVVSGKPVPTLDPADGVVTVPAGTPAGTYHITYRICEVLNPTNCDDAIITINVEAPAIVADADTYTFNGQTGAETTTPTTGLSVLDNDELNGVDIDPADPASLALISLTSGTPPHPGISMDPATGIITVAPGTPARTYTYPYTICEVLNPTNCTTGIATITVTAPTITAVADPSLTITNGANGGTTTSVLANDVLGNENPLDPSDVRLVPGTVSGGPATVTDASQYLTMNPDGTISVRSGTPAGTYTYTYDICEVLNPANCTTTPGTATIVVGAAGIDAVDDDYTLSPVNGATGSPNVGNALTNDRLNNVQATLDKVTIPLASIVPATPQATAPVGNTNVPVLNPATGVVSVPAGTPAGSYMIEYEICEILNPTNCDDATITVNVVAAPIVADPNLYGPVTTVAGHPNLGNALENDRLNGLPVTLDKIILTVTPASPLDPANTNTLVPIMSDVTGQVSVPSGTPAGTYTIPYEICELLNPTNCANTTVTVIVSPSPIHAVNDNYGPVVGIEAHNFGNALSTDSFNGKNAATALTNGQIDIKVLTPAAQQPGAPAAYAANVPVLNTTTGVVTSPANTPAGRYDIEYEICEVADPTTCDKAWITVWITPAQIDPDDDFYSNISSVSGTTDAGNVLDNDKLNFVQADIAQVSIEVISAAAPINGSANIPVLNESTGQISVPAGTPAGEYRIRYRICELLNPTNCDHATALIQVALPQIAAVDNTYAPVNSTDGDSNLGNVLTNDTYNGAAATLSDVSLRVVDQAKSVAGASNTLVPLLDEATGQVSVPATTPVGKYEIQYEICDLINPANCSRAVVKVEVFGAAIVAEDDNFGPVIGRVGNTSAGNVLANDRFNSVTPGSATTGNVRITVTAPATPHHEAVNTNVPVLDPATGNVSVPVGTPAATYQIHYRICDLINPSNCDDAIVTINVTVATIDAVSDDYSSQPINGYVGGSLTIPTVLANDLLNGAAVVPSEVIFTPGATPHINITMSSTGTITVKSGTPEDTYLYPYTICEALNPANCDQAVATIVVTKAPIVANPDTPPSINGKSGGKTPSVFDNDTLNGDPIDENEVKLLPGVSPHPGLTMNSDGTVTVMPNTPEGSYPYPYTICEVLNPTNCSTSTITVTVIRATIEAIDDDYTSRPINGYTGGITDASVLTNDLLNGVAVTAGDVEFTPLVSSDPAVTMDSHGIITVAPGTAEGTYTHTYRICEVLNLTNCDEATATIRVAAAPIHAVDDIIYVQNTRHGATSIETVLTNDRLNGAPLLDGEFTLTPGMPSNPDLSMNPDGTIKVAPGTKPGEYQYPYTICEVLNPTNCDDAVAVIIVEAPELFIPNIFTPNDDAFNPYFEIVGYEAFDRIELTVINRWGNEVYRDENYNNRWDGRGLSEGTYFYIVRAIRAGKSTVHKGYVTIKRN